jgi:NTE family protein
VIAGLEEAGVDLRHADLFVGTSAGSVVAAQLTSGLAIDKLFQQQVDPDQQVNELMPQIAFNRLRADLARAKEDGGGALEILQRIGARALAAKTVSEAQRRDVIAARLPVHIWPERALRVVAVDVESGARRVFDRFSEIDLIDAVAASCAVPGVWPPVTIGGRRYMDGGVYATENADLAIGCDHVLVLALTPRPPSIAATSLDAALKALRDNDSNRGGIRVGWRQSAGPVGSRDRGPSRTHAGSKHRRSPCSLTAVRDFSDRPRFCPCRPHGRDGRLIAVDAPKSPACSP